MTAGYTTGNGGIPENYIADRPANGSCPCGAEPVKIPWQSLPGQTLDRLLAEIVTRDGTDYGQSEKTTAQKLEHARNQLRCGQAVLMWNAELESASLVTPEEAAAREQAEQ